MYYDVHLLPRDATDDPRAAIATRDAQVLASDGVPAPQQATAVEFAVVDGEAVDAAVVEAVRAKWVKPGEGLRIDVRRGAVTVRLPYWYVGKPAREQAKVLHAVVKDLEKATGLRGFDPQLDDWFTGRSYKDTAAVLDAVADFQAREKMDSPAVDARRAARAAAGRPRPIFRRRSS
ncbi:MAG: hypothetical protein WCA29_03910 [Jiangellales bacterium]